MRVPFHDFGPKMIQKESFLAHFWGRDLAKNYTSGANGSREIGGFAIGRALEGPGRESRATPSIPGKTGDFVRKMVIFWSFCRGIGRFKNRSFLVGPGISGPGSGSRAFAWSISGQVRSKMAGPGQK